MKLTELLKSISPLPWTEEGPCRTTEQERAANKSYGVHAANVFPALIERLKIIRDSKTILPAKDLRAIAANAIAMAEEVQDAPAALTTPDKTPTVTTP